MRKKQQRDVNTIGKDNYGFEYRKEKNIYCHLCGINCNKKGVKRLAANEKMNTYSEWEQYVSKKYEEYPVQKLKEFSRYLNQRIRNLKPNQAYWNIILPILLTLIVTEGFNFLMNLGVIEQKESIIVSASVFFQMFLAYFIVTLMVSGILIFLLVKVITPIWENHTEEKILEDYKEIIDNMIKNMK